MSQEFPKIGILYVFDVTLFRVCCCHNDVNTHYWCGRPGAAVNFGCCGTSTGYCSPVCGRDTYLEKGQRDVTDVEIRFRL